MWGGKGGNKYTTSYYLHKERERNYEDQSKKKIELYNFKKKLQEESIIPTQPVQPNSAACPLRQMFLRGGRISSSLACL